jgi:hypothetical protein
METDSLLICGLQVLAHDEVTGEAVILESAAERWIT